MTLLKMLSSSDGKSFPVCCWSFDPFNWKDILFSDYASWLFCIPCPFSFFFVGRWIDTLCCFSQRWVSVFDEIVCRVSTWSGDGQNLNRLSSLRGLKRAIDSIDVIHRFWTKLMNGAEAIRKNSILIRIVVVERMKSLQNDDRFLSSSKLMMWVWTKRNLH